MMFHRPTPARWRDLACLAAAVALSAFAAPPAAAQISRAEQVAIMDSIAESPVIEGRVAGLAVAVIHGADTLLMKSYGKADLEWNVPMTEDAVFEIGSVTKQFTAAAILKLRDEGKIDLDADMTQYSPTILPRGIASLCADCSTTRRGSRASRRWRPSARSGCATFQGTP
jgi:CubicO group peptidase (beta-lactamase class C family)